MNKEELEIEINKTKEQLNKLQQALENKKYERWQPEIRERYYSFDGCGTIYQCVWDNDCIDQKRNNFYGCFKTREEAKSEAEKILIRRQLEDIARRLNKNVKIDWYDSNQHKFYINYTLKDDRLDCYAHWTDKVAGVVYCLDKNFLDIALREIGKEKLTKYLKGE